MWQIEMTQELKDAPKCSDRTKIIRKYETLTGKSRETLYRIARNHGFSSGKKKRKDVGSRKITENQIMFVASLIHTTAREVKGAIMPVEKALRIAEDNGIIDPGTISVSRMTSVLREVGMSKRHLDAAEPSIRMQSLHPNHVHILDASVCIQYYLKGKKGLRMMDERKFYKNKWENFAKVRRKLIRYVLADHYSHAIFLKYYYTGGETQENLYDFICSAWEDSGNPKFPFRGVPFMVLMDAGAANMSKAILAFLERLDISLPKSMPHNPRRQGSAEVTQNIVERSFESGLRIQPAMTVEQLNEWAMDWAVWFNGTKLHSRHKMTRFACWLKIRKEQLRDLPDQDILHALFAEPEKECHVYSDYSIRFRSNVYDVRSVEGVIPNMSKVMAVLRPYTFPEIAVRFRDKEYILNPIRINEAGFREDAAVIGEDYKSMPETSTQQKKKQAENLAYGEEKPKDAVPFEGITVMGNQADKVNVEFMPRRGVRIATSHDVSEETHIPILEFLKRLRAEIGNIPPELNQELRTLYGGCISLSEAEAVIARMRNQEQNGQRMAI